MFINGCLRADHSRTLQIAQTYIEKMQQNEEVQLMEHDLSQEKISYLTQASFDPETGEVLGGDCTLAREFAQADEIIVAAPFWEFMFPAVVSCYFEQVSVPSITFQYTEHGSVGLCRASSITYIYTSGDYLQQDDRVGEQYLERLGRLYGIPGFTAISAQGLDVEPDQAQQRVDELCRKIISGEES